VATHNKSTVGQQSPPYVRRVIPIKPTRLLKVGIEAPAKLTVPSIPVIRVRSREPFLWRLITSSFDVGAQINNDAVMRSCNYFAILFVWPTR
jgi:hypothetical protein